MIRVEGLSKKFGAVQALSDVSFEAQDGRITGLLGHNGAGKSTTLRILSTVMRPNVAVPSSTATIAWSSRCEVRGSLGVLPHASGLYAHLTGRENIRYYGKLHGLHGRRARSSDGRADRAARARRRRRSTRQGLFAGRASEGRARPRARASTAHVILDEPTNGLDVNAVRMLRELIRQLRAAGRCVLFSSHVMQEVAALCDDIVIISHGRVVVRGTPAEILAATGAADLEEAFVRAADGGVPA